MKDETDIDLPDANQLVRAIGATSRRLTLLRELQKFILKRDRHAANAEKILREKEGQSDE